MFFSPNLQFSQAIFHICILISTNLVLLSYLPTLSQTPPPRCERCPPPEAWIPCRVPIATNGTSFIGAAFKKTTQDRAPNGEKKKNKKIPTRNIGNSALIREMLPSNVHVIHDDPQVVEIFSETFFFRMWCQKESLMFKYPKWWQTNGDHFWGFCKVEWSLWQPSWWKVSPNWVWTEFVAAEKVCTVNPRQPVDWTWNIRSRL